MRMSAQFLAGGGNDMTAMVCRYGGMLEALCVRLLRDRYLAQDAVQETFLKAYLKRETFRGGSESSEGAWLARIAVNVCRDQQRTAWFRFVDGRVSMDALSPAAAGSVEEAVLLKDAVRSLPEKYGRVVRMRYYQDMTAEEIAAVLHQSTDSVYRRLREARAMLGEMLAEGA